MTSEITYKRIIKLIALTYAINENKLWEIFCTVQSVDKILTMIENKEIE